MFSGMRDGCSRKVLCLKCPNDNRTETACELFLKDNGENVTPLQVRGGMGVENILLPKHMILLCKPVHNGHISGRSTHNTRIEYFWPDHNTAVKDNF